MGSQSFLKSKDDKKSAVSVENDNSLSLIRPGENMRKTTLKENTEKLKKVNYYKELEKRKAPSYVSQLQDEISTEGRTESEKRSELSVGRKTTLNDEASSQNGVRLYQIQKMNHSLKDANVENFTNIPNINQNSKIEGLKNTHNFSCNDHISRSVKGRHGVIKMKNQGSRNESISNIQKVKTNDKKSESLTDKFMRQSEEFTMRRSQMNSKTLSKSLSKAKKHRVNFSSLSINSRRKVKNKDLKDSVRLFVDILVAIKFKKY